MPALADTETDSSEMSGSEMSLVIEDQSTSGMSSLQLSLQQFMVAEVNVDNETEDETGADESGIQNDIEE